MKILAIETSCDETALSLIQVTESGEETTVQVLATLIQSQIDVHKEFGGVFPGLAKREHLKNLPLLLEQVMDDQEPPDYLCVTTGPGLEPALWTGIVFAKELSLKWNIPIIPVNHMEGHILSVLVPHTLQSSFSFKKDHFKFPALALLISGGHTELVLVKAIGDYEIIGKTRDDAVGEAFDKVARLLGLPYPGGPEIAKLANRYEGDPKPDFPRPMIHSKDYDFSFSGLKTAVLYHLKSLDHPPTELEKISIAYEFQEAVTETLVKKTWKAIRELFVRSLIVGGGVAANQRIRDALETQVRGFFAPEDLHFAIRDLTGDNALMIALAGYFKIKKSPDAIYPLDSIRAEGNLSL